jgi:hypothetical protein
LFQVKDVPTVIIEEATPSPADSQTNIRMSSPAAGIWNNAAEIP